MKKVSTKKLLKLQKEKSTEKLYLQEEIKEKIYIQPTKIFPKIPAETVQYSERHNSLSRRRLGACHLSLESSSCLVSNLVELLDSKNHIKSYDQKSRRDSFSHFF